MSYCNHTVGKGIRSKDLIRDLRRICYSNTEHYRSDFEVDEQIIKSVAEKPDEEKDTLLWLSYPSGTKCLFEKNVFMRDSAAYHAWIFYSKQMQSARKIAYALEIGSINNGKVEGILYELDFVKHCKIVEERAVDAEFVHPIWVPKDRQKLQSTLLTEKLRRDGRMVSVSLELKEKLETFWQGEVKRAFVGETVLCPRCGKTMQKKLHHNCVSRYGECYVCELCGMEESVSVMPERQALPLTQWHADLDSIELDEGKNKFRLTNKCNFMHLFENQMEGKRSVREVCYSRSDYNGYRWWTTWELLCEKLSNELAEEIDGFMEAVFAMPEFRSFNTMRRACAAAEQTSDPTEYNLYSETLNFYIWIRLIDREKDYHMYVHYYQKDLEDERIECR